MQSREEYTLRVGREGGQGNKSRTRMRALKMQRSAHDARRTRHPLSSATREFGACALPLSPPIHPRPHALIDHPTTWRQSTLLASSLVRSTSVYVSSKPWSMGNKG